MGYRLVILLLSLLVFTGCIQDNYSVDRAIIHQIKEESKQGGKYYFQDTYQISKNYLLYPDSNYAFSGDQVIAYRWAYEVSKLGLNEDDLIKLYSELKGTDLKEGTVYNLKEARSVSLSGRVMDFDFGNTPN